MSLLEKIIAAYYYYKGQCGDGVVMFRYNDHYNACFDDARRVSNALGIEVAEGCGLVVVQLPADSILDYVDELSMYGIRVMLVDYRNDRGDYDIPDVAIINKEKTEDY